MEVETAKDASQKTIRRVAPDVQNVFTQYQYPTYPERCLHGHAKEESPANPKSIPCPQHPGRKPLRRPALCFPSKRSQLYFPVEVLTIWLVKSKLNQATSSAESLIKSVLAELVVYLFPSSVSQRKSCVRQLEREELTQAHPSHSSPVQPNRAVPLLRQENANASDKLSSSVQLDDVSRVSAHVGKLSDRLQHMLDIHGLKNPRDLYDVLNQELKKLEAQREQHMALVFKSRVKHVMAIRRLFDAIDKNGSDQISRFEFREYLMVMERSHPNSRLFNEAESIFSTLDRGCDGVVNFSELLKLWYPYLKSDESKTLAQMAPSSNQTPPEVIAGERTWEQSDLDNMRKQFLAMDVSGDGELNRFEFTNALVGIMSANVSKKARRRCAKMLDQWFDEIDVDHSGNISFNEFVAWYTNSVSEYKASCT